MFFLITLEEENGNTVVKSIGGNTETQCLKNALKEHLITREAKELYERGIPCLTIIEADSQTEAIQSLQNRFNEVYGKYAHIEIQ